MNSVLMKSICSLGGGEPTCQTSSSNTVYGQGTCTTRTANIITGGRHEAGYVDGLRISIVVRARMAINMD